MCIKIELLFLILCLGECLALYPNANYDSIVTSTKSNPSLEYGVPSRPNIKFVLPKKQEVRHSSVVYGLPDTKVPAIIYGVPSRTFDIDFTDLVEMETEKVPQKPETSGVTQIPATSYGVPVQKVVIPKNTVIKGEEVEKSEKAPQKPHEDYGVPKLQIPGISYGVPAQKVLVPSKSTFKTFDVLDSVEEETDDTKTPQNPSGTFVLPKPQTPAISYGVPVQKVASTFNQLPVLKKPSTFFTKKPSEEYGLPEVRTPAAVYRVPF